MSDNGMTYRNAGVNIDEGNRFVGKIKKIVSKNIGSRNLSGIGSFGGLFDFSNLPYKNPVLVTSIDGVGTKLYIAQMLNRHDTVGIDIVSHCINDILVQGAKPLFFTDYLGCGILDADVMAKVIEGIVATCKKADCELMGGETAEMPGLYKPGDYDLVGSITGVVEKDKIISGKNIKEGDVLISLPSNGLHTNGYSLA
ncbi:MAG: Phosphoribosylformylglycinamidine cyclo-ligase, partial [uncultured bacterium]